MEIRKLQNTASGSFFITLPKEWITDLNIKKGEKLVISRDEEGTLKLSQLKNRENFYNEFIIAIEDYPEDSSLERCINSSYIQGSDVIIISSQKTISIEKKQVIKESTFYLIGAEISEEFSNKIIIRILVDPLKFPLHSLIKRIYTLVSSMHVDALKSFRENDEALAQDVINREIEVDKLFFLMLRQLNLSLSNRLNLSDICDSEMKIDCVLGIVLARDLSKMSHYAVEIAKQSLKLVEKEINPELKEHISKMSRFVIKMQQNAILSFFKNDFMRANEVLNHIQKVIDFDLETENEVLNKISDTSTIISLITISSNLRNIANSALAVSQDLQAKHRPKATYKKELGSEKFFEPLDLIESLGYEKEEK
ncbi:MAG: phosphate uptake regulator PhoU [Candidatus Helarchaeota archaeon]|nr:phosphate uptake regulator PhoU [Candidatus Helarchaeota archaeon]